MEKRRYRPTSVPDDPWNTTRYFTPLGVELEMVTAVLCTTSGVGVSSLAAVIVVAAVVVVVMVVVVVVMVVVVVVVAVMVVVAPRVAVAAAVVVVGVKMAVAIAVAVGVSQEAGRGRKLHEAWFFLVLTPHWASPSLQHLRDRTDGSWQGTVHASLVNLVDVSLQYTPDPGLLTLSLLKSQSLHRRLLWRLWLWLWLLLWLRWLQSRRSW